MASKWNFQWLKRLLGLGNGGHFAPDTAGAVLVHKTTNQHYPLERRVTRVGRDPANEVVLADEPSGNLDSGNKAALHDLMRDLAREMKQAFVIVTHDPDVALRADREVRMADGRVAEVRKNQVKRET